MMIWSSPVFDPSDRWMAFGSLDGEIYLLDPETGSTGLLRSRAWDVKASLVTDGAGQLFFGTTDGKFLAVTVDNADGRWRLRRNWNSRHPERSTPRPLSRAERLYFGSMDGNVYCLDTAGRLQWEYHVYSPVASSPLLTTDGYAIFGAANGRLYVLDARSGERQWSFSTANGLQKANLDASPVLDSAGTIWAGSYSGILFRIPAGYCETAAVGCALPVRRTRGRPGLFGGFHPRGHRHTSGRIHGWPIRIGGRQSGLAFHAAQSSPGGLRTRSVPLRRRHQRVVSAHSSLARRPGNPGSRPGAGVVCVLRREVPRFRPEALFAAGNSLSPGNQRAILPAKRLAARPPAVVLAAAVFRNNRILDADRGTDSLPAEAEMPGWAVHSLYLEQPKALDTYIPAGLDAQGYILRPFAMDEVAGQGEGHFLIMGLPGLPTDHGVQFLPDPTRAFVLHADKSGEALSVPENFHFSRWV